MRITLTDAARYDLERRLKGRTYLGAEIGLTLKSVLLTPKDVSIRQTIFSLGSLLYLLFVGTRHKPTRLEYKRNRILFTLVDGTSRFKRLVLPILKCFPVDESSAISGGRESFEDFPTGLTEYTMQETFPLNALPARLAAFLCLPMTCLTLIGWVRANRLSWGLLPQFLHHICFRYVYLKGAYEFLQRTSPRLIVFDYEHYGAWACLSLMARRLSIPTVNLMHGEIYSAYAWVPLLSDVIACWGESQKRQLLGYGLDDARIKVCGCPRLEKKPRVDVASVCRRLDIDPAKPIALLATNPILWKYREMQVTAFAMALKDLQDVQGLARLHPVETLNDYCDVINRYPWIKFYEAKNWTLEESIAVSRVVVNHDSGLGDDALAYGRPVIELDVLPIGLTNGRKLVERAGCPCARNADELKLAIEAICLKAGGFERQLELASSFVKDLFFAFDNEAGKNTALVCSALMGSFKSK